MGDTVRLKSRFEIEKILKKMSSREDEGKMIVKGEVKFLTEIEERSLEEVSIEFSRKENAINVTTSGKTIIMYFPFSTKVFSSGDLISIGIKKENPRSSIFIRGYNLNIEYIENKI